MLSVSFLPGLIRGDVGSDYLLRKINFNIPIRPSRNFNLFNLQFHRRTNMVVYTLEKRREVGL